MGGKMNGARQTHYGIIYEEIGIDRLVSDKLFQLFNQFILAGEMISLYAIHKKGVLGINAEAIYCHNVKQLGILDDACIFWGNVLEDDIAYAIDDYIFTPTGWREQYIGT
jgi:hypothetical protein